MKYKDAGVDVDAGSLFVDAIKPLARSTFTPGVVTALGSFSSVFAPPWENYQDPLLVATTDGVGTKLKVALMAGRHDTIGIDLVAMCVNDLLTVGAEPLFFLDYFACGKLEVEKGIEVVKGIAAGCREAGCALVGGETAEMPGFYLPGEYDLSGFAVGIVEKEQMIDGSAIKEGDKVIGLASAGLHSNGFSLVRKVLFEKLKLRLDEFFSWGKRVDEELLTPTKIYVKALKGLKQKGLIPKGIAHITGGGLLENPPRILPPQLSINLYEERWSVPPIFSFLQKMGEIPRFEMYRTFNMGVGMVLIFSPNKAETAAKELFEQGYSSWIVGEVVKGDKKVRI